jgi:hypothetical protein
MKVYTLMHGRDHHPLYVCHSKEIAERVCERIDIACYIQEIHFITEEDDNNTISQNEKKLISCDR